MAEGINRFQCIGITECQLSKIKMLHKCAVGNRLSGEPETLSDKIWKIWVAAIAPWFRLRLPSCGPRFESQAHHLCFFQFVLLKLYRENHENKQKEAGIGPFFKKNMENLAK